ncbi:MAG: glycosyltransferase [Candidatus Rokubacteria bacterium]|nr:glycosyltransferase [Candidatus Rokubacteria bacterium]
MRERVTLVMPLFNQLPLTRACLDRLAATTEPFRLVVIDNGSTDGTRELFRRFPYPYPLRFIESDDNHSVIAAFNRAWPAAETEFVCLMHNDTEMVDPRWLAKLLGALDDPTVGMTGLFGVKRMRRNSRFVGRTVVHSLAEGPTVRPPAEDVVALDAVCLCLRRSLLEAVGGLDEAYGFYHGFDKDLSFAVRERGLRCRVVWAPFYHHGGGTRATDFGKDPERARRDIELRKVAIDRFLAKWGHRLPADTRRPGERVLDWLAARLRRPRTVYSWPGRDEQSLGGVQPTKASRPRR